MNCGRRGAISYVVAGALIKKIKIFSYIGKFNVEQLQSHIRGRFPNTYMRKCANISPYMMRPLVIYSNGNASETKANESFDYSVFFYIEAKRTPSLERKLFSKRSEHIR